MPLIIFSEYLSPFHFGKVVIFRSWIEVLAVFYVVLITWDPRWLPKRNSIFWAITTFTLVFGLTTWLSVDRYQSFWGTLERMGGWFTFLHFWLYFVMMVSVLRKKEDWLTFAKVAVWASLLSTLYGLLQKTEIKSIVGSGGRARIFGTIGNPALFAGYELLNVFLALFLVLRQEINRRAKLWYALIFLLDLIAVFMTAVRGSLLAAVVSLFLFAMLFVGGRAKSEGASAAGTKKLRRWLLGGIGLLVVLEIFLIFNRHSDFVQKSGYLSRLSDVSFKTRTVSTRFWAWEAGLNGWNDHPKTIVFGWGPENFNVPFSKHFNPKFYIGPGSETLFDRGHNMFVEIMVTMGPLGLLSYLAVFLVLFSALRSVRVRAVSTGDRMSAATLMAGLWAYIIHNFFIFDTSANFMIFFLVAGLVYWLKEWSLPPASTRQPAESVNNTSKAKPAPMLATTIVVTILTILTAVSIYKTNFKPAKANHTSTRAIVASWEGRHVDAVKKFEESLTYQTFIDYEVRHRYGQYVMENLNKFKVAEDRKALLLSIIEHIKKNIRSKDQDYLPYLYISRAYILLGKDDPKSEYNDLALTNSLKALEIAPQFIRTYFEVAQAYLNKKDYVGANQYFKNASELNPDVGMIYWYWAATEYELGNLAKGKELVKKAEEKGYHLSDDDYGRILKTYVVRKDYKNIIEIYKKIIEHESRNAQYHASLAATYVKVGQIDEAIIEAKKAAELDPSFEAEARGFVEALGRKW